ncbi:hypothetical protein I3260_14350 [Photobacterium damselae]|uniref:hypothetical protein n=1 Tax=Photobacterium damselae TaxID=38293 RepID=UPI001EE011D4|nr:hypothetical protein [Photobacterium damselae]MCG3813425.1 hypothetical protein [Photobacterium damselae]
MKVYLQLKKELDFLRSLMFDLIDMGEFEYFAKIYDDYHLRLVNFSKCYEEVYDELSIIEPQDDKLYKKDLIQ